jgi:hypothetical protein
MIKFLGEKAQADILLSEEYSVPLDDSSIRDLTDLCGKDNLDLVYHSGLHLN